MARYILYFTILALLPIIYGQCNHDKASSYFKRSVYDFSIGLTSRISEDLENHFVTSTLSPWTLLATLSLGATGNTLADLKKVLRLHPHKCFNNKFFEIIQTLTSSEQGEILERSASIVIDKRLSVKNEFIQKLNTAKISELNLMDFDNFAVVAQSINNFVNNATHGAIEEIITAEDLEGVYLVLIDALYFKGTWVVQFDKADTEESEFFDEKAYQIGNVNMMFVQGLFKMAKVRNIRADVLELPYQNGRFSMLVILPEQGVTVPSVIDDLRSVSLSSILYLLDESGKDEIYVSIPKFSLSSEIDNLRELLSDMGLRSIFSPTSATFTDISDFSVYVSSFIQKATLEVNEEGATASAVSAATVSYRMQPPSFTANRPFLFTIIDRQTELPIFIGAYSKPSL